MTLITERPLCLRQCKRLKTGGFFLVPRGILFLGQVARFTLAGLHWVMQFWQPNDLGMATTIAAVASLGFHVAGVQ